VEVRGEGEKKSHRLVNKGLLSRGEKKTPAKWSENYSASRRAKREGFAVSIIENRREGGCSLKEKITERRGNNEPGGSHHFLVVREEKAIGALGKILGDV